MLAWTDNFFLGLKLQQSVQTLSLFANSSRWCHKISKVIKMMPKMFVVLALLANGAVAVRSNTWLSEGQLEPEKVDEVQKRLNSELGISATRQQVEVFIRTMRTKFGKKGDLMVAEGGYTILRHYAKLYLPLDVGASAVAFCSDLVKAMSLHSEKAAQVNIKNKLRGGGEELCSQVLTGNLSKKSSAPTWAVKAAEVAEMDHKQHPYGRLDGVAWRYSLKRVCHDECEELVKGIKDKAEELGKSPFRGTGTIEDACADEVVRHVEAEILGCCSKSCGWNGQFCSFFPFLNSTEQADWQAECCSERNILQGSSRQQLCDSTLSQADKNMSQNLTDQRPNNEKDRDILAQDESQDSKSWSLMERSFGGSLDNNTCPPPINLHKIHKELEKEWKRIQFGPVNNPNINMEKRLVRCKNRTESRGKCKAFLLDETTDDQNKNIFKNEYICLESCGLKPPNPKSKLEDLTDQAQSAYGFVYVHKDIYSTWKLT